MGPKRNINLTLDLNAAPGVKRSRGAGGSILASPDVNKLKLTSPQIQQLIVQGHSGATPTVAAATAAGYVFPPNNTQAQQELLVKQFADASSAMKKPTAVAVPAAAVITRAAKQMSGGGVLLPSTIADTVSATGSSETARPPSNASSSDSDQLEIKQEPEDEEQETASPTSSGKGRKGKGRSRGGPGGSAFAPIDMDSQEMIKLERKRSRNRVAATKCRKKKLEKISKLEERVQACKNENTDLAAILKQLKENVCNLKQEIMAHVSHGCKIDTLPAS